MDQNTHFIFEEFFSFLFYVVIIVDILLLMLAIFLFPNGVRCGADVQNI